MNLNAVIVGHVDHGKSTLIGRLLYDSEVLPEDRMAEIQKLLEEYKKRFEFAYFLDSFEEELKEERTIDTTRVLFKGRNYYTIVDVPGHKEFIKNMLTGACHAQVAILVVSAPDGVQEQTRRHAFLVHMLGIKEIIVAINKMDLEDYQPDKFDRVREEVIQLLSSLGYAKTQFIPISAMEGDNVYKPSPRMAWYQGPTLIQALDAIEPAKVVVKSLRFVVQDIYQVDSEKITVGRVESGSLKKGDELVFQPSGAKGRVTKIKVFPEEVAEAASGDSVGIVVECETKRGDVAGHATNQPTAVASFLGEVALLEGTLSRGEELEMKCGTKRTRCLVEEIRERINSETGEVIGKGIAQIEENEAATIIFKTEPMVVEKFSEIPELGRFIIARGKKNIGAGVVLSREV
ncbi:MAG: GTP-binding protein [Dehalococcoidales bacterium]